jgi:hypothetical protein
VGGTGVDKMEENVGVDTGVVPSDGFADSGVDADSVANRSVVGVDADEPKLQARSASKIPLQKKSRLFILLLN